MRDLTAAVLGTVIPTREWLPAGRRGVEDCCGRF